MMNFPELLITAAALGTDAFAVTLANGLAFSGSKFSRIMLMPLTFCVFRGVMPIIGYYSVGVLNMDFSAYTDILMFVIFMFLGGKMIYDWIRLRRSSGIEKDDIKRTKKLNFAWLTVQAFGTSVDAFAVGIVLGTSGNGIAFPAAVISAVTLLMCTAALILGKVCSLKAGENGTALGGLLLVALAVKALI